MGSQTLTKVIKVYLDTEVGNKKQEVRELVEQKIVDDVKKDIINTYKEGLLNEVREQVEHEMQLEKIKHLKYLVIETLIVSFFVGLLANQFTDIISHLKGVQGINLSGTTITVMLLLLITYLGGKYLYLNNFSAIVSKILSKNKHSKIKNE